MYKFSKKSTTKMFLLGNRENLNKSDREIKFKNKITRVTLLKNQR